MEWNWTTIVTLIKDIWWIVSVPLTLVAGLGMYYLRGQFLTKEEYDAGTKELQGALQDLSDSERATSDRFAASERQTADRLAKLEADLRLLPGRAEFQQLSDRISRVEREVAASAETTRGIDKTVTKIDHTLNLLLDHMLKKGVPT